MPSPLEAAFAAEERGEPVDWNALREPDRALLTALEDRDPEGAREALRAGADPRMQCGYGATALMLAAASGDEELVAQMKAGGATVTPGAEPYLEVLEFRRRAESPEFQQALAEVERLTGRKAQPGDRPGAYALELQAEKARAFLEEHHDRLREAGCFAFLHAQNFGIGGKPDEVWLLPTRDKFAVMACTGVNGINYELTNFLVIRWMRKLDGRAPYTLRGCGEDFLSGRFAGILADPEGMAREMYAFCPDIVEQGTGSVEDLEKELRRTGELYFWWD